MNRRATGAIFLLLVGGVCALNALVGGAEGNAAPSDNSEDTAWHASDTTSGNVDSTLPGGNVVAEATPTAVPWVERWSSAVEAAVASGKPIFAYLALDPRTCPPCARLDREVFGLPEARAIADVAVPLRVYLHQPVDPETQSFVDSLNVRVLPTLVVVTPDRHVLARRHSGLYGVYNLDRSVASEGREGTVGLDAMYAMIAVATRREAEDRPRFVALSRLDDPDAHFELALLYRSRERYDDAELHLHRALAHRDDVETRALLAFVLRDARQRGAARKTFEALVAAEPDHPQHLAWRIELTQLRLSQHHAPGPAMRSAQAVAALELAEVAALAASRVRFDIEAHAMLHLAQLHEQMDATEDLIGVLEWFDRRRCDSPEARAFEEPLASDVRFELAQICARNGRHDMAVRQYDCLEREHPESIEAQMLKHGILDAARKEAAEPQ